MDKIIDLTADEAKALLRELEVVQSSGGLSKLAVCIDGDAVKFKINEYTWSPPMGTLRKQ